MGALAKFRPVILSVKIDSHLADLNPTTILSIIYHFQLKFPKEKLLYTYFPKDKKTDWFKGYGFIHFQPSSAGYSDHKRLVGRSKDRHERNKDTEKHLHDEYERFKTIKNNPVQEVQILKTTDIPQLRLSNFTDLNNFNPAISSTSTNSLFSQKFLKCFVELSQSNNSPPGIQSCQTIQIHQPKLSVEQFDQFSSAFCAFGGFKKSSTYNK